ncbi:hypothetical protein [Vibrio anguillarum]|uniref:hypothetical protein n=1 Tax=Vibrio anguillarum TaxID=55601 RepID=UPI00188DA02E|nr:hypothetical protein [Vibrio anguillarum]
MKIEIKSEAEYEQVSKDLSATMDHPLAYELPELVNYEETIEALEKWRKENPINKNGF